MENTPIEITQSSIEASFNNQPPENTPKSHKKAVLVAILCLIIAGGLYIYLYPASKKAEETILNVQKSSLSESQAIGGTYLELKKYEDTLTPEQVANLNMIAIDRAIKAQDTSKLLYTKSLGYEFKTPWGTGTESEKTKNSPNLKQIVFANGKKIMLSCSTTTPRYEFTNPNPVTGNTFPQEDTNQILAFLGQKADSGFEYTNLLLSSKVEDVKNADTLEKAQGLSKLLILKATQAFSKQAYRFVSQNVRGFQFGDYSTTSSINVMIFTSDASKCQIFANESNSISQDDVDVIVSTFKPL